MNKITGNNPKKMLGMKVPFIPGRLFLLISLWVAKNKGKYKSKGSELLTCVSLIAFVTVQKKKLIKR